MADTPDVWHTQLPRGGQPRGDLVDVVVECKIPKRRLVTIEQLWGPARLKLPEDAQHDHWRWTHKDLSEYRVAAVSCGGRCEGLMAVSTAPRLSRDPQTQPPDNTCLYVQYLEAAPWNLKMWPGGPSLLGVGPVLMLEAVRSSVVAGLAGRIGLHSLPQAETFYRKLGMDDCGYDPNERLRYFERTPTAAATFLAKHKGG